MVAVTQLVEYAPLRRHLRIESDSKYAINSATKFLTKWEDQGYIGIENKQLAQAQVATLRQRKAKTEFRWVKGHNGNTLNEGADKLANEGANRPSGFPINLTIPPDLKLTGAKLSVMTQSLAYQAIRQVVMNDFYKSRRRTEINIDRTKAEIEATFGRVPTEARIWKSLQHRDFSREVRQFMWKMMHDAFMVGNKWERGNKPEFHARSECLYCKEIESMEHILCECSSPGQAEIWALAENLWAGKNMTWIKPTYGNILGCGLAEFKNTKGSVDSGAARLFRIIVSESAYLIWKLRNERVIQKQNEPITPTEIHNRWVQCINDRLEQDCRMTNPKYKKKAILYSKVIRTWTGTLKDESYLQPDWPKQHGVLVGIGPLQKDGRSDRGRRGR
ncbi:hypothetical protein DFH06DRAFT_1006518 [Mycena polygramma]|nr:hypothetical protein DFH06DRAFT_1006518 [Mycena polygramma]